MRAAATLWLLGAVLHPALGETPLALRLKTFRSTSRRFVLVGTNSIDCMQLGRWAEGIIGRVEQVTGESIAVEPHELRLSLYAPEAQDPEPTRIKRWFAGPGIVRRLRLLQPSDAATIEAEAALCGLIFETLADTMTMARPGKAPSPAMAPPWLARGLAENLDPARRAANRQRAARDWTRGRLGALAGHVRDLDGHDGLDAVVCGVLVDWLLRPPGRESRLTALVALTRDRAPIDLPWLVDVFQEASPAALDERWDRYMLGERRVVFAPATPISGVHDRLAGELLLYPGDCGIPLASDLQAGAPFEALLDRRDAPWIASFCRMKGFELQMLTAGRDTASAEVVAAYRLFLEDLAAGRREKRLRERLETAERAWQALKREQAEQGAIEP